MSKENETITYVLLDYIECALHQILHTRNIYPSILFGRTSKYGTALYQCRHVEINEFIRRVLNNAKALIMNNLIKQLKFVCFDHNGCIKDEIVFEMMENSVQSNIQLNAANLVQIEKEFRISLLRLNIQLENMSPFDPGMQFMWIMVYCLKQLLSCVSVYIYMCVHI